MRLSANAPVKAAEDGPSARVPITYSGDLNGILGAWIWPGAVLAVSFGK